MNSLRKQKSAQRLQKWLGALYRIFFIGMLCSGVAVVSAGLWFSYNWLDRPIELITVKGQFSHIQQEEIEQLVEPLINGGIVSLNLTEISQQLEKHVWIKHVSVSRQWANGLLIEVQEETPIARWKSKGFLNSTGQLLKIDDNSALQSLTMLDGPDGEALIVMKGYREVADLMARHNLHIAVMGKDESGIWHLQIQNGPRLVFGRTKIIDKTHRFLTVWNKTLIEQSGQLVRVDLRYSNGLAVAWKKQSVVTNG